MTKTGKTWTVTCRWGCGHTWETPRKPPADGLGCGAGECLAKHNAVVAAADEAARLRRNERARARRANPPTVQYAGEWAQVGMLLGANVRKGK